MTRAELLGGLASATTVALGYFVAMALLSRWGMPGFGFLLVVSLGFAGSVSGIRLRNGAR
jgi:hypothetical protein